MAIPLERWRAVRAAAPGWVLAAAARRRQPLTAPACPVCRTPMPDTVDLVLRVPWYTCACGFAGTMIHALARGDILERAAREVGGADPAVDTFLEAEAALASLAAWWRDMTTPLLSSLPADAWPGGRERFLASCGLPDSRPVLDALYGLVVPSDRCDRPIRPERRRLNRFGAIPWPAAHLALYAASGRPAGLLEVTPLEGQLRIRPLRLFWSNDPLWVGPVGDPAARVTGDPAEFLRETALGEAVVLSPYPTLAAARFGLATAGDAVSWHDGDGRSLPYSKGVSHSTVRTETATVVSDGLLYVVRHGRLLYPSGAVAWPAVYRVGAVAAAAGERWYQVFDGGTAEWVAEEDFSNWLRARTPHGRWGRLVQALAHAAFALGPPAAVRSERTLGWDPPCRGFGVPGGLVRGGAFEAQPWRGPVPPAGYPIRPVVELGGLTPAERLVTTGLCRRWADTVGGPPLPPAEEKEAKARPDRARRLVGFLLWLTASTDRLARAQMRDAGLAGEWVRSEFAQAAGPSANPSRPSAAMASAHG